MDTPYVPLSGVLGVTPAASFTIDGGYARAFSPSGKRLALSRGKITSNIVLIKDLK